MCVVVEQRSKRRKGGNTQQAHSRLSGSWREVSYFENTNQLDEEMEIIKMWLLCWMKRVLEKEKWLIYVVPGIFTDC